MLSTFRIRSMFMKKIYNYIVPPVIIVAVSVLMLCTYFLCGDLTTFLTTPVLPITAVCVFALFYGAELLCVRFSKYPAAIALSFIKYIVLDCFTLYAFYKFFAGIFMMVIVGVITVVGIALALGALLLCPTVFLLLALSSVGKIAEPILLIVEMEKVKKEKREALAQKDVSANE